MPLDPKHDHQLLLAPARGRLPQRVDTCDQPSGRPWDANAPRAPGTLFELGQVGGVKVAPSLVQGGPAVPKGLAGQPNLVGILPEVDRRQPIPLLGRKLAMPTPCDPIELPVQAEDAHEGCLPYLGNPSLVT